MSNAACLITSVVGLMLAARAAQAFFARTNVIAWYPTWKEIAAILAFNVYFWPAVYLLGTGLGVI